MYSLTAFDTELYLFGEFKKTYLKWLFNSCYNSVKDRRRKDVNLAEFWKIWPSTQAHKKKEKNFQQQYLTQYIV